MRRVAQILVMSAMAPLILGGCATIGPPQPPSLELPKPPADLRASRKGDRVLLSWTIPDTTTDRQTIRILGPTQICRGPGVLKACGSPAGQVNTPVPRREPSGKKPQGSYADTLPAQLEGQSPSSSITYSVQVLNHDGRAAGLSNQVQVPLVRTLAAPREFRGRVEKEGVVLNWSGDAVPAASGDMQYVYRVYRHPEGSNEVTLAGETPAGQTEMTVTDTTIEWQNTYYYHAEAVTLIGQADKTQRVVEGDDTPEVKVFADDVFPPAVPTEVQAVYSGPGQKAFIDLVWAPVADVDLAGYNVYRREEGATAVKVNAELVKTPAYRDTDVASGKRYFYSVSAMDVRGNESARSEEASESVP